MTDSKPSKVLRAALYVLVPAAYLSVVFWRPSGAYVSDAYGRIGREGISPFCAALMTTVFLVSLLSWNKQRRMSVLGLLACFLWLTVVLLPVL
jgi:hypothetical protein